MKEIVLYTERCILKALTPELIHHVFQNKDKTEIMEQFKLDEKGYGLYLSMHEKDADL